MNAPVPCTEDDIAALVHGFYGKVRQDALLGPIFDAHVNNWDIHLSKMVDFWSAMLLGTRRFRGTPMPKHIALPDLSADLFQRWLALFRETADEQPNQAMAQRTCEMAQRVAQSLWYGYQISRQPDAIPQDLAQG